MSSRSIKNLESMNTQKLPVLQMYVKLLLHSEASTEHPAETHIFNEDKGVKTMDQRPMKRNKRKILHTVYSVSG